MAIENDSGLKVAPIDVLQRTSLYIYNVNKLSIYAKTVDFRRNAITKVSREWVEGYAHQVWPNLDILEIDLDVDMIGDEPLLVEVKQDDTHEEGDKKPVMHSFTELIKWCEKEETIKIIKNTYKFLIEVENTIEENALLPASVVNEIVKNIIDDWTTNNFLAIWPNGGAFVYDLSEEGLGKCKPFSSFVIPADFDGTTEGLGVYDADDLGDWLDQKFAKYGFKVDDFLPED